MAKKSNVTWEAPPRKKSPDVNRPKNKHKRANYKKYRGQGR